MDRTCFILDDHHVFKTRMPMMACGNTAKMLTETRFSAHFDVTEDFKIILVCLIVIAIHLAIEPGG